MKGRYKHAGALLLLLASAAAAPSLTMWLVPTGDCSSVLIRFILTKKEGFLYVAQGFPGYDDDQLDTFDATQCSWEKWKVTNDNEVSCSPYEDANKTQYVCEALVTGLVPQLTYFYGYNTRDRSPAALSSSVHVFEAPSCGVPSTTRSLRHDCGIEYQWSQPEAHEAKLFFFADVGRDAGGQAVAAAVYDAAHDVSKPSCQSGTNGKLHCTAGMPVAIVLGGDTSYSNKNSQKKWDQFLNSLAPVLLSKALVWVSPGNHDVLYGNEPGYTLRFAAPNIITAGQRTTCKQHADTAFPGRYYSFNIGRMHVIAVCNHCDTDPTSEQAHFVRTDMKCYDEETTPFLVGVVHEPWYTSSSEHFSAGTATKEAFESTFLEHGMNVMMSGHIHSMEVVSRQPDDDGILHVTAGHGGRERSYEFLNPLENTTWTIARAIEGPGFSTVSVNADGLGQLDIFYLDAEEETVNTAYSQQLSSRHSEPAAPQDGTSESASFSPTASETGSASPSASSTPSATPSASGTEEPYSATETSTPTPSYSTSAAPSAPSLASLSPEPVISPSQAISHTKIATATPRTVSATASSSIQSQSSTTSVASSPTSTTTITALATVSATSGAGLPVVSASAHDSPPSASSTPSESPSSSGGSADNHVLPPSLAVGETVPLVVGMFAVCILLAASFSWLRARRRAARRTIDITSAPAASSARAPTDLEVTAQDVDLALDSDDENARLNLAAAAAVGPASSSRKAKAKLEDKSPKASVRKKQTASLSTKKQQDRIAGTHLMTTETPDDDEAAGWAWTADDDHVELTSTKVDVAFAGRDPSRKHQHQPRGGAPPSASSEMSAVAISHEPRSHEEKVLPSAGKKGMRLASSRTTTTAESAKPPHPDVESITVRSFEPAPQGNGNGWNIDDDDFDLQ